MNNLKQNRKRKVNRDNVSTLYLDTETSEMLKFLADRTLRSQVSILREIIHNMTQIQAMFKKGNYWLTQNGDVINIQFFGEKNQITQINEPIE